MHTHTLPKPSYFPSTTTFKLLQNKKAQIPEYLYKYWQAVLKFIRTHHYKSKEKTANIQFFNHIIIVNFFKKILDASRYYLYLGKALVLPKPKLF